MPRWYEMLAGTVFFVIGVPPWIDLVFGSNGPVPLLPAIAVPMLGWVMVMCFQGLRRTQR